MSRPPIDLGPLNNPRWREMVSRPFFDAGTCDSIVAGLKPDRWNSARLAGDEENGPNLLDRKVRSADLQLLPLDDSWPYDDLRTTLSAINAEVHHFDITGFSPTDTPAVVRYEAGTNDHFRPHNDMGERFSTRKITFVVQLSDPATYNGGDLVFPEIGLSGPRDQGTLIAFPSFLTHVVSPVVEGTRHVIVGWLHGPTFT